MSVADLALLPYWAAFVAVFWLVPRRFQAHFLVATCTAWMLFVSQTASWLLLAALSPACFWLAKAGPRGRGVGLAVGGVVGTLAIYKLVQGYGGEPGQPLVLLGTSFYLLRLAHYLIEAGKQSLPEHSLVHFLAYAFFLPTLTVGPINRFPEFMRDEHRRRWDSKLFIGGLERILFGHFKVIVVANYLVQTKLGLVAERVGGDTTALGAYLHCLEYGLDLYFRFGGYCDIAIGLSALLGFRILENFNYPFLRSNINRFWQSWHMSLSGWCRDYVFAPIAFTLRRPSVGVLASMLIFGLWHEISPRYIVWGIYHGAGILAWQYWQRASQSIPESWRLPHALAVPIGTLITFNFVVLSFAITRSATLGDAAAIFATIFLGP
jgi:alginate O-acetyltransferase complex protein AlgI